MTEPTRQRQRRRAARRTELGASAVAGGVGAGFGAAKIRDAHVEQYPGRLQGAVSRRAIKRVEHHGADFKRAERGVHLALHAKPGFKSLVAATAAGTVATAANRYGQHEDRLMHRAKQQSVLHKRAEGYAVSAFGVVHGPVAKKKVGDQPVRRGTATTKPMRALRVQNEARLPQVREDRLLRQAGRLRRL